MVTMGVCGLLVILGLAGVVVWGGERLHTPAGGDGGDHGDQRAGGPPAASVARRYLWYLMIAFASGVASGVLVAGAGGRLAMRLLAATAGDAAQGRETEAEEIVGQITTGGTVGFVIFTALIFGLATGALYVLVRRWLPAGRLGGLTFGALLLVVAATRIDPLRADNPDFDIVGPGWLAAAVFGALVLVHGMLVAALASRTSRALPLVSPRVRHVLPYAPLLLLLPAVAVAVFLALVGALAVAASRSEPLVRALLSHRALVAGRTVIAIVALVALPSCVSAIVDIIGRPA